MTIRLKELHPFVSFLYYVCAGVCMMMFTHPLFLSVSILILVGVNILQGTWGKLIRSMPAIACMGLIIIVMNPLFVRRGATVLFYFRHNPVTLEGVAYGMIMAMSLWGIFILFISFNDVIHGRKFLFLFSKVWPRLALLLMITVRFVPLLITRWKELYHTQKLRGHDMFNGSVKKRSKTGMLYMQKLLTWSLEEALQTAESMNARGFGERKRSHYQLFPFRYSDWGASIVLAGIAGVCVYFAQHGIGTLNVYPQLETLSFSPSDWLILILFICLMAFPILLEGGSQLRWHVLNSTN